MPPLSHFWYWTVMFVVVEAAASICSDDSCVGTARMAGRSDRSARDVKEDGRCMMVYAEVVLSAAIGVEC